MHRWTPLIALAVIACEENGSSADPTPAAAAPSTADLADPSPEPDDQREAPPPGTPHCEYENPFSRAPECKLYAGSGWTSDSMAADCASVMPGAAGELGTAGCGIDEMLGRCVVEGEQGYELVLGGGNPDGCALARTGCETFAGGRFLPEPPCVTDDEPAPPPASAGSAFVWPYQDCRDPVQGEPPGAGPNGQVCTQIAISGCTEPGRDYADYGDCDVVRTQRPYWPANSPSLTDDDDPRLSDDAYLGELAWVTGEVTSCACGCCHTQQLAPNGPSGWFVDDEEGIWVDRVTDSGLALMAGWVDSSVLGAYAPAENNGFDRDHTAIPTTDVARLRAFFVAELGRRGVAPEDCGDRPGFGGPRYEQRVHEPEVCAGSLGVTADGEVRWAGGDARYVYLLEAGSANPGVPPNLDLPEGTVWRIDVDPSARPVQSGIRLGEIPPGARQVVPAQGASPALEGGREYYLYVLYDVGVPLTRCLFTAPR